MHGRRSRSTSSMSVRCGHVDSLELVRQSWSQQAGGWRSELCLSAVNYISRLIMYLNRPRRGAVPPYRIPRDGDGAVVARRRGRARAAPAVVPRARRTPSQAAGRPRAAASVRAPPSRPHAHPPAPSPVPPSSPRPPSHVARALSCAPPPDRSPRASAHPISHALRRSPCRRIRAAPPSRGEH